MKKITKILLLVFIFSFIITSNAQAVPLKKYNKYNDNNISLSYPNEWSVENSLSYSPYIGDENYYFIKNKQFVSNDAVITITISSPTTSTINSIKNKFPFAGNKMKKGKISTIKFLGSKGFKRVADYKDNLNRPQRILAYWTINNKEEIWVYYQGSVKWYNKYYNDAVKIINSIKLKNKPVNNIITLNPGSASGEDVCDSDCAEKILSNCSQGNFSIIRNSDLGVTKLNFKILNQQGSSSGMCKTGVSISQSSKPDLVGPSMECILKPKIKSLYDLQNFVTDKFAPLNSNNYSSCSGSLYDMVKDLIL